LAVVAGSTQLAGAELSADELKQAAWAFENGKTIGVAIKGATVTPASR